MIIDYDHNPVLSVDQKMQSLVENLQLMSNEIDTKFEEIMKAIIELQERN